MVLDGQVDFGESLLELVQPGIRVKEQASCLAGEFFQLSKIGSKLPSLDSNSENYNIVFLRHFDGFIIFNDTLSVVPVREYD